jgi:ferredoxin
MLYVDSDECIDCAARISVCPVHAIYDAVDLPDDKKEWQAVNAERARALPVIDTKQTQLPTAEMRRLELGFR